MARGGARIRSGPPADPDSGRSDRRKFTLQSLPAEGFAGRIPAFPLARFDIVHVVEGEIEVDEHASKVFRAREIALWRELWRTPQAAAWSLPENKWRHRIVATYARHSVRIESPNVSPALMGQIHRFADQIGMTDAGLGAMGWKIAVTDKDAPPSPAGPSPRAKAPAPKQGARTRLKVLPGGVA